MLDFKKEYKDLYQPSTKPSIVTVPKMRFLAVSGKGNPNDEDGEYKTALGALYAVAYTLKMSYKTGGVATRRCFYERLSPLIKKSAPKLML